MCRSPFLQAQFVRNGPGAGKALGQAPEPRFSPPKHRGVPPVFREETDFDVPWGLSLPQRGSPQKRTALLSAGSHADLWEGTWVCSKRGTLKMDGFFFPPFNEPKKYPPNSQKAHPLEHVRVFWTSGQIPQKITCP